MQEGFEAAFGVAVARQPLVITHEDRHQHQRAVVPAAQRGHVPDERQAEEHQHLQPADHEQVRVAEQYGGRLHADPAIVLAVGHGVERVVDYGPGQRHAEQEPRQLLGRACLRRECHRHGPPERRSQHELRDRDEALDERVDDRQPGRDHRQHLRGPVQHRCESHGDQGQRDEQGQRLHRRDRAGRQRAGAGALDVRVDLAIRKIVQHAAGRAHYDHAEDENRKQGAVGAAVARQPEGPEGGPEQQPDTDGFVEPHELRVVPELRREARGGSPACACHVSCHVGCSWSAVPRCRSQIVRPIKYQKGSGRVALKLCRTGASCPASAG